MLIYQHKDGRTQQAQEWEKVKISLLEQGGWKPTVTAIAQEPVSEPAEAMPVREVLSTPTTPKRRVRSKAK